jgi:hypothetical protein
MTELNIPLLTKLLLVESRILEFGDKKREQFRNVVRRLGYTHYSWRIVRLMLQISPWKTAVVVFGRLIEGIFPAIDMRIKGRFLDLVIFSSVTGADFRFKLLLRRSHSVDQNSTNSVYSKFVSTFSSLHLRTTCMYPSEFTLRFQN